MSSNTQPGPKVTDRPPDEVANDLSILRLALDEAIPQKALDRNLLIATWNLKAFGGLTEKWHASSNDSPKRDLQSLLIIAEIISRFDVVALQEVRGNLKALRHTLRVLGSNYSFILTDVTKGKKGNGERLAFLFDSRKVRLSGLAAELVVPQEQMEAHDIEEDALDRQFARTPYAVSFWSGGRTFILTTLHVLYGDDPEDRIPELKGIAKWLADWAVDMSEWDHNLIALGDFNIDREGDALYKAFTSTGLTVAKHLNAVPRSIFFDPEAEKHKFYDQIAWFTDKNKGVPALSLEYVNGGFFDFTAHALGSRDLTRQELQWRVSDHFPLWVEFSVR